MTLLYDIPVLYRTILLCLVFLILWVTMMQLAEVVYQRMYRGFGVFFLPMVIVNYIFFQLCLDEKYNIKLWAVLVYIAVMILFDTIILRIIKRYRHENFTVISVKQGLDAMEEGICFYTENGLPQFVNEAMNDMSIRLTGTTINDASAFWKKLRKREISEDCTIISGNEEMVIVKTPEKVCAFSNRNMEVGDELKEMVMVDITSEYRTFEELLAKTESLELRQARLKEYNRNVTTATIEKELLNAKVHIHDELGEILLAAKRYVKTGDGNRQLLTDFWMKNLKLLGVERKQEEQDEYKEIYKAAADIGMKIEIEGSLPEEKTAKTVTASALHECLTNTFRHAGGDTVYVKAETRDGKLALTFTNNGNPPEGPIEEHGGLKSLRKIAEDAGYEMSIDTKKGFMLNLISVK
ncbi:MAG: hypothetical protein IKW90_14910 [Lachnospiraceae bacterium]|nr:hypothetical protein [Lachnospiraceae bacterium]